jgi:integral membrane protein
VKNALTAYRVIAWVVGIWLLLLVVGMVRKYGFQDSTMVEVVGPVHGFLYMLYLGAAFWLGSTVRWRPSRLLAVMLAGTVPFLSFVAERSVTGEVRRRLGSPAAR